MLPKICCCAFWMGCLLLTASGLGPNAPGLRVCISCQVSVWALQLLQCGLNTVGIFCFAVTLNVTMILWALVKKQGSASGTEAFHRLSGRQLAQHPKAGRAMDDVLSEVGFSRRRREEATFPKIWDRVKANGGGTVVQSHCWWLWLAVCSHSQLCVPFLEKVKPYQPWRNTWTSHVPYYICLHFHFCLIRP